MYDGLNRMNPIGVPTRNVTVVTRGGRHAATVGAGGVGARSYAAPVSIGVYVAVFIVALVASTVQSSTGFGQGLIAAPLFRLLHPDLLPVPIVVTGLLIAVLVARQNTQLRDVRAIAPAVGGRFVGIGIALVLLATLSERGLSLLVGVIVLSFVLLRVSNVRLPQSTATLAGAGAASGVGGTVAALGGAPMALLYVQHAEARDFRGPLAAYTLIGSSLTILALLLAGRFDLEALKLIGMLLPPIGCGMVLSRWATPVIDRGYLRPLVLVLSGCSAVVLILSEIFV